MGKHCWDYKKWYFVWLSVLLQDVQNTKKDASHGTQIYMTKNNHANIF